ncbi:hypothetical protein GH714_027192 [Hevea brasiliensis]|uniref:Uncharacterized protein n=1 Tax=Hevea brasiliensis TaxID=3981 RepID=A0A6A6NJC3_HEVBR|nr:hypothetical protein GH714_027192 [Hevea brasiliensis]
MALLLNMSCPCFFSHLLFVFFVYALVPFSSCQSNSQNIETFYPFPVPSPSPAPSPANSNKPNSSFLPPGKSPSPQPSALPLPEPRSSSSTTVAKAVAATAVSTFVVATLLFFFIQRYVVARRRTKRVDAISGGGKPPPPVLDYDKFSQVDGSLKGVIVDENGLDMLYWRNLKRKTRMKVFRKKTQKKTMMMDNKVGPEIGSPDRFMAPSINPQSEMVVKAIEKSNLTSQTSNLSHLLPSPSAAPPLPPLPPPPAMAIPAKQAPATPPPPIPAKQNAPPPPPPTPPIPAKKNNATPPPPPIPAKKNNSTPPPPPIPAKKSTTPPHLRHPRQLVLLRLQKYLRWLKGCQIRVNQGSLQLEKAGQETGMARFDDDLMEALFGSVATNRRSPNDGVISDPKNQKGSLPAQIAILMSGNPRT